VTDKPLGPNDAIAALTAVAASMRAQFGEHHAGRLGQLDQAVATAVMAVQHLVDEEAREVDLANRIIAREKVHGSDASNEVSSPISRDYADTLRIAGRA
jgi:hypothetical protein